MAGTTRFLCVVDKVNFYLGYNVNLPSKEQSADNGDPTLGLSLIGFESDKVYPGVDGFKLFALEIPYIDFDNLKSSGGRPYVYLFQQDFIDGNRIALITIDYSEDGSSYAYPLYGQDAPRRFVIKRISFQSYENPNFFNCKNIFPLFGPPLNIQPDVISIKHTGEFSLIPYSVGQGMCSLLHNNKIGYLLDAGAGKPVLRGDYISGSFVNQLTDDVAELEELYLILSHLDSDHFRLLRWDSNLLNKISKIYIPSGLVWLDRYERQIADKVHDVSCLTVVSDNLNLECYRTRLNNNSLAKNDNELVVCLSVGGALALYPGDYVYSKMRSDLTQAIVNFQVGSYSFICAPHHGDLDSQHDIPSVQDDYSLVFFSAGNHRSWNHPTQESVDAHTNRGFATITLNNLAAIERISNHLPGTCKAIT